MKKYLNNCFLLLIPILLWNVFLAPYLPIGYSPEVFDHNIPQWVTIPENALRLLVFLFPLTMVLSIKSTQQKIGLGLFILGTLLYFLSWFWLIAYPTSNWSLSTEGFTAPAYTPLVWLLGLGMMGEESFFKFKYNTVVYVPLVVIFVIVHLKHAMMVFENFMKTWTFP